MSVVIPAHNAAAHIAASVRSVLAQTFGDLELVVVDDGSTDDTVGVLASFDDPRLRVVRGPHRGIVGAANAGLDTARGELIARHDADDIMGAERLARQVAYLDRHPSVVACGTDYEMFGLRTGVVRMPRSAAGCRARLLFGCPVINSTATVRAWAVEAPDGVRYREEFAYAEDYRFFMELSAHGDLVNLPYVGLRYRIHATQSSSVEEAAQRRVAIAIALDNLRRNGVAGVDAAALERMMWMDRRGVRAATDYLVRAAPAMVRAGGRAGGTAGALTALQLVRERLNTALRASR